MSEMQAEAARSKDDTLQELARKLPEGDALPDGFSEGPPETDSHPHRQDVRDVNGVSNYEGALPENVADSYATTPVCPERSVMSSGSSDVSADPNDGSPCSSPSTRKRERKERPRSFPVQLSASDNLEDALAAVTVAEDKACINSKNEVHSVDADINNGLCNFTDAATRAAQKREQESLSDIGARGQDATPEIDQLIHGTAMFDNGVQTVEGLHSSLLEDEIADLRKQNEQLANEKQMVSAQLAKSLQMREKLESLCRELQRHNKQLTDERKQIASEEQQKRLDLSTRFHDAIKDVTAKLEEQGDERLRQIKQNELLQDKLRQFTQQYEFQEQQYSQQLRTKSLEQQILEVKLKQQEEIAKQGETNLQTYTEQITQLLQTEQDLRGRLSLYGEKFEQFQDMLTKSNEVFTSFKAQMESMSKTIKKLEKENLALQKKCEKSNVSLIELVDERANLKHQVETSRNQKEKLEALCRILQAERKQQNLAMASVAASAAASGAITAAAALKSEQVE